MLAQEITRHLRVPLGRARVERFSDGEVNVELMENVRGRDVFIVQPTCPPAENLMELLMMTDGDQADKSCINHYFFSLSLGFKSSDAEFMQYLSPVGAGPSSNTCPRWAPHFAQRASVRTIP